MGGSGGGSYSGGGGSYGGSSRSGTSVEPTDTSNGDFGGGGGGGGGGSKLLPCIDIKFIAVLNSPQPTIVSNLKPGDILTITINSGSSISVVAMKDGNIAGAVTGQNISDLISCIQNGYNYVAKVIEVKNGKCDIEVFYQ